jgi:hypothetical protein
VRFFDRDGVLPGRLMMDRTPLRSGPGRNLRLVNKLRRDFAAALFFAFAGFLNAAQSPEPVDRIWLEQHYTKAEYQIPMRDSVKLFTAVFSPTDTSTNYPMWLTRTPYGVGPYGSNVFPVPNGPMKYYAREGFIFVLQDVRGRNSSEGEFVQVRPLNSDGVNASKPDESTDAWDTIEWLVRHVTNNNGRVGMSGISYPGFYAACGAINSHPALKAVSPQAPIGDWFMGDDYHRNGALYLSKAFDSGLNQMLVRPTRETPARFKFGTHDGYQFFLGLGPLVSADSRAGFWQDIVAHGNYDKFWQARNPRPHLTNIHSAILMVGGWYDAEDLFGTLEVYRGIEKQNPGIQNTLVMGPWSHGGWSSEDGRRLGPITFGSNTCAFFRIEVELPFFNTFLKGPSKCDLPEAVVFETGANEWRRFSAWPPTNAAKKSLYFQADGRLSFMRPDEAEDAFDEYVSDPVRPVPFTPNATLGMPREYMVGDQRFAAARTDVLVYQTEVLKEPVTLVGPVGVTLNVSTTGSDADWVVKLIDVHPFASANAAEAEMDGYQQLVRGEPMRGKFRNSFEKPEPFEPGKLTRVEWAMCDVLHTFRRGHRIMVQVQSTWFPLFDRNPQTFCDIYRAKPQDFRRATQRVFRTSSMASCLRVNVLSPRNEIAPPDTSD